MYGNEEMVASVNAASHFPITMVYAGQSDKNTRRRGKEEKKEKKKQSNGC